MADESRDGGKRAAAEYAAGLVRGGMRLGLGTGSTADWFVRLLAGRVRDENLPVEMVATSRRTAELASREGLTVADFDRCPELDLAVDGADEVDRSLDLVKGGGGALLMEKIVAASAARMIVVADESKLVDALGAYPLPVEVARFGWQGTNARIGECLRKRGFGEATGALRREGPEPFVTDQGHYILDFALSRVDDAATLSRELSEIAGVMETGLFVGMCDLAILGGADGQIRVLDRPQGA